MLNKGVSTVKLNETVNIIDDAYEQGNKNIYI